MEWSGETQSSPMGEIYAETLPGFGADVLAGRPLDVQRGRGGRLVVIAGDALIVARVLTPNQRVIDALHAGQRYTGRVRRALDGTVLLLRVVER